MKIHFLLWLLYIFLLNAKMFSQDAEELRLFSEANTSRFTSPEKSIKLYDYLLKNSETKAFNVLIGIKKLQVYRFLGEYRNAIKNSQSIEDQLKVLSNPELSYLYYIEITKLYQELELTDKASLALQKAEKIYDNLPVQLSNRYSIDLALAQNYLLQDSELKEKIEGLKTIVFNIPSTDERLSWLQYRLSKLYISVDIDSASIYAKRIPTENNLGLISCIFETRPCDASILKNDFNEKQIHPDLKIVILKHNLELWESKNIRDSIIAIRRQLQDIENVFEIEKKQAKVDLLQLIYEGKRQQVYSNQRINKKRWIFGIMALSGLILIYFGVLYYRKSMRSKTHETEETTSKPIVISDKTEIQILEKLEHFESSELFLDQQMRIATLAKHLDTNTRYLSTIINATKDKSFNNYINSLRINYILKKLGSDPKYFTYKISYLAEESGFASQSSFTTAFKEVTGKTPSIYIKELETKH